MCPIEDGDCQTEKYYLSKLQSDIQLEMIPDYLLFIYEVSALVLILRLLLIFILRPT